MRCSINVALPASFDCSLLLFLRSSILFQVHLFYFPSVISFSSKSIFLLFFFTKLVHILPPGFVRNPSPDLSSGCLSDEEIREGNSYKAHGRVECIEAHLGEGLEHGRVQLQHQKPREVADRVADASGLWVGKRFVLMALLWLAFSLSVLLSAYFSVCWSFCLAVCLYGFLSVCLSVWLVFSLSFCLSVFFCLSFSLCLSVCLSLCAVSPSINIIAIVAIIIFINTDIDIDISDAYIIIITTVTQHR